MSSHRKIIVIVCSLVLTVFSSCKKKDGANPSISIIPEISLQSVSPASIHAITDSLLFVISYIDGDGDLGDYDADTLSVWITDNRFPLTEKFHLQPLAPQGSTITISGELKIILDHIIMKNDTAASEDATFSVKIKDRAGHWSNTVVSETISILP